MLARWAKVMGPGRSRSPNALPDILAPQKIIWDPSAPRPASGTMFGAGIAPVPSFGKSSATSETSRTHPAASNSPSVQQSSKAMDDADRIASRLANIPPAITDPSQISVTHVREAADPNISRVVATLKAKLHAQPGLNLDIIGILATLAQRCEQAHKHIMETSADGSWQNDIWYLSAKKVLIARAKLEKWAEIIAAGGVSETGHKAHLNNRDRDVQMRDAPFEAGALPAPAPAAAAETMSQSPYHGPDEEALAAFQREMDSAAESALLPEAMYDADMYGSVWMDNMFDPLDPSLWFNTDDPNDWSMALLGPTQDIQPNI